MKHFDAMDAILAVILLVCVALAIQSYMDYLPPA